MALTYQPPYEQTPIIAQVKIATANTNTDGTGTLGAVLTGSTNGTGVTSITIKAEVTTTAGMVRLYIDNLSIVCLIYEQNIAAITKTATVAAFYVNIPFEDLIIPSGYILKASTEKAESFSIIAFAGNL